MRATYSCVIITSAKTCCEISSFSVISTIAMTCCEIMPDYIGQSWAMTPQQQLAEEQTAQFNQEMQEYILLQSQAINSQRQSGQLQIDKLVWACRPVPDLYFEPSNLGRALLSVNQINQLLTSRLVFHAMLEPWNLVHSQLTRTQHDRVLPRRPVSCMNLQLSNRASLVSYLSLLVLLCLACIFSCELQATAGKNARSHHSTEAKVDTGK